MRSTVLSITLQSVFPDLTFQVFLKILCYILTYLMTESQLGKFPTNFQCFLNSGKYINARQIFRDLLPLTEVKIW